MLVLTRRPEKNDAVIIRTPHGEVITVTVLSVDANQVRVGFACDKSIQVWRKELEDANQAKAGGVAVPPADVGGSRELCMDLISDLSTRVAALERILGE